MQDLRTNAAGISRDFLPLEKPQRAYEYRRPAADTFTTYTSNDKPFLDCDQRRRKPERAESLASVTTHQYWVFPDAMSIGTRGFSKQKASDFAVQSGRIFLFSYEVGCV